MTPTPPPEPPRETPRETPHETPHETKALLVLALAAVASLVIHLLLVQWPVEIADLGDPLPPLSATLTTLPPPPAPVAQAPRKPRVRKSTPAQVQPAAQVASVTPTPVVANEPAATATEPQAGATESNPTPSEAAEPLDEPVHVASAVQAPPKQLPPRVDLAYRAFLGTHGFLIGNATYRLEHSANQYVISTVGEARGLAALLFPGQAKAQSKGVITANGLQPDSYSIERTSGHEAATFDWAAGMVLLKDDKSMPLDLPTFDPLVVLWQFYFSPPAGDEMEFNIATTRKVYHYGFKRVGSEKVTLPFGDVDAEIWKKVSGDGVIDAQIWLAPALRYVAVKIRLDNGRVTVEGLLDSIRADDDKTGDSNTVAQQ